MGTGRDRSTLTLLGESSTLALSRLGASSTGSLGAGMTEGEGLGRSSRDEVGEWWADALDPSRGLGMTV